jgi:F-type H+-transporting ATPase subunit b
MIVAQLPMSASALLALFDPPWWDYPGLELWKFFNLAVFLGAAIFLLRKPVSNMFWARGEAIMRELEQARKERDEALAKLAEVEARLGRVDEEASLIQQQARVEAENEAARIARETESEMKRLQDQARREIEAAAKVARHELRAFAAEQSAGLAEEILKREMGPDDDSRLVRLSVDQLGGSPR